MDRKEMLNFWCRARPECDGLEGENAAGGGAERLFVPQKGVSREATLAATKPAFC